MKKTNKSHSIRQVAELLGISEHRIAYAHRTGKIPEPEHVAGKRIYSVAATMQVAKHFHVQLKKEAK
jgi:DNA-binding transcriptional MerR regulator